MSASKEILPGKNKAPEKTRHKKDFSGGWKTSASKTSTIKGGIAKTALEKPK